MSWKESVISRIESVLKQPLTFISSSTIGGGDINEAYLFKTSSGDFFVKKNSAIRFPQMFQKEALGLKVLAKTGEIPVPEVITVGQDENVAFLILKPIQSAAKQKGFWRTFAQNLANLHKRSASSFGLDNDNYIGSLHQSNRKHKSWPDFFREERLEIQLKLARDSGQAGRDVSQMFNRFYNKLGELFPEEPPALIHGDLWGGNYMVNEKGEAVIIDPAIYYGHREMDLGMSQLFGGFDGSFYEAYNEHFPLEKNWQQRLDYCNLYPLMVHVNLFGGSYLGSVKSILRKF